MCNLCSFGVVGTEVLYFSDERCVIFLAQGPVNKVGVLLTIGEQEFVLGGDGSVVLSNWTSMERMGVDRATTAVSGKELWKGGVEVIGDERGNYVLFTIRDNEKVAGASSIKVVLPPRTWVNSWLRTIGTWGTSLCVSIHRFRFQCVSLSLLV